jgi:hypothetical protein
VRTGGMEPGTVNMLASALTATPGLSDAKVCIRWSFKPRVPSLQTGKEKPKEECANRGDGTLACEHARIGPGR